MTSKRVAYVFQDVAGWYVCDDLAGVLDTRGMRYETKNQAIRALKEKARNGQTDYTHYRTGGSVARKLPVEVK